MTASDLFQYVLAEAPVIAAVGFAVYFFARRDNKQQLGEQSLAGAVDRLTAKLDEVVNAIEHMDKRLDDHDIEIAVLKAKHKEEE